MTPLQVVVLIVAAVTLAGIAMVGARAAVRALGDDPDQDPPWLILAPIVYVFRKWLYRRR